jgi:hypothetical protein
MLSFGSGGNRNLLTSTDWRLHSRKKATSVKPPNPPWIPLVLAVDAPAVLSFYYSDPQSHIPVREVTRPDDNKADPNLETMSYGLFSTCERGMRAGVVKRGIELLFFCTGRASGVRVLTGFYRLGWHHRSPTIKGYSTGRLHLEHYALAAKEVKFVSPGFPLGHPVLRRYLKGHRLDRSFRTFMYIDRKTAQRLLLLLQQSPDSTTQYISEIRRLELLNLKQSGFRYPVRNMKRSFSWNIAPKYMGI